jgi:hypothetical protein
VCGEETVDQKNPPEEKKLVVVCTVCPGLSPISDKLIEPLKIRSLIPHFLSRKSPKSP